MTHAPHSPAAPTRPLRPGLLALTLALPTALYGSPATEAACSLAARPGQPLVDVPFDVVDGRIHVQVRVNDSGPYRFAVDTGASGLARADARLVRRLALPAGAPTANSDGVQTATTETARIAALALGAVRRSEVTALTRDYNTRASAAAAFDGILARGFFADGLLVIDYPQRRLQFRRDVQLLPAQPGTLSYTRAFRIPVTIGTVATEAQLDTGANVAMVLPTALYRQASAGAVSGGERLTLGHGQLEAGRAWLAEPVVVSGLTLRGLEVRVSDRYPEAVLGAHALQDAVLLIDQRSQRIAICPRALQPG
ncbi:TPA: aspartyl protease family protein [Stenotrophomonas maltophilia]|nr:aspartyl protease family protein [Stenotrophomonas maltophilia]